MDPNQSQQSNPAAANDQTQPLPATEAAVVNGAETPAMDSLQFDATSSNPTTPTHPIQPPTNAMEDVSEVKREGEERELPIHSVYEGIIEIATDPAYYQIFVEATALKAKYDESVDIRMIDVNDEEARVP